VDHLRKARIASLAALLVIAFLLILPYIVEGFTWSILQLLVIYGLGFAMLLAYLLLLPRREGIPSKKKVGDIGEIKTVTAIGCLGCDFSEEREFKTGDYINKQVGKCQKCGGDLYIKKIYAVELKRR
jgi:hypothetical protein